MAEMSGSQNMAGRSTARRRDGRREGPPRPDRYAVRAAGLGMATGLAVVSLLLVMVSVGAYAYFQVFDLILPGVYVGDVPLGGMTAEQAAAELNRVWNTERGLLLSDGERTWYAPPSDFGLALDAAATAQRALDVGHGQGVVSEVLQMADGLLNGHAVAPVVTLDEETARAGLERWAEAVNLPPQDATVRLEDGEVVAVPGRPGLTLDVEQTLAVLTADPGLALADGYLPLVLIPVAPRISDASQAVEEARQLLSAPLQITVYDPITDEERSFTAPPEVIAGWLTVEAGEAGLEVAVSEERVAAYLDELDDSLGEGRTLVPVRSIEPIREALRTHTPATLIVSHPPTTYTVQPGDTLTSISWEVGIPYWRILEANPGLEADTLSAGQVLTIPSKDELLPLPIVMGKRIVVSISEQRMWVYENGELIAENVISTGIDRSPTQPGVFQVQTHELSAYAAIWDLTMPHFLGIYEAWPGFMNGFHGLPTLSGGQILWADVLGRPASYGCIILDLDAAEALYNWAEDGVVVEIRE